MAGTLGSGESGEKARLTVRVYNGERIAEELLKKA
jgi:hypothetical protein